eukprot:2333391-Amphidinium_carterae.1
MLSTKLTLLQDEILRVAAAIVETASQFSGEVYLRSSGCKECLSLRVVSVFYVTSTFINLLVLE